VYDLAVRLGCEAFVSGPLMRIGRAAAAWDRIACGEHEWQQTVDRLRALCARGSATQLSRERLAGLSRCMALGGSRRLHRCLSG